MDKESKYAGRVNHYIKYRPGYPSEIIDMLEREIKFDEHVDIADIGSGPGNLSRLFLVNGNLVYGVEPDDTMREAGERLLKNYINFISIKGTAESTTLMDDCVDMIVSGQAFHWFDTGKARKEFDRILRTGGYALLIWNERKKDASPFMKAYEKFLGQIRFDKTRHEQMDEKIFVKFFGAKNFKLVKFSNSQVFDFTGLKGRFLSTSYAPLDGPEHKKMMDELKKIFDKHNDDGEVRFEYVTKVYFGKIKK